MRVLFVLPETPDIGGGGIATYLNHARTALEQAGHEVFTFTWVFQENDSNNRKPKNTEKNRIISISGREVWEKFPNGPFQIALSYLLLPHISAWIEKVNPDVIETSDFKAPLYGLLAERRAGRFQQFRNIPIIGFNHGLQRSLYSCNGMLPVISAQEEMAGERQMMRWCDLIIAPSHSAMACLKHQIGSLDPISVIYEPYIWDSDRQISCLAGNNFYHLGRLSFLKGIDHEVHFLNAVEPLMKIENVYFLGPSEYIPFRINESKEYIYNRVKPSLRNRLRFLGHVNQQMYSEIFCAGGYSMNFSIQETFNYAAVEMIANGIFPFIKAGTAMEEFLPEAIRHIMLPNDFNLNGLEFLIEDVYLNCQDYFYQIISYLQNLTCPKKFVGQYEKAIDQLKRSKRKPFIIENTVYKGSDVSILMATFNNPVLIKESIESVQSQTISHKELIIVDDGSNDPASLDVLNHFEKKPGIRIIYSNRNEGLCATRMKLIRAANTPLSIFLDSDDILSSDYLEKTLHAINESPLKPDAVLTWRKNFGINKELIINDLIGDHYHLIKNDFRMTCLIKTEVLRKIGFLNSMRNGEADDWLFWLDFTERDYKAVMVGEPLFNYRFAENSMSWPWSQGNAALTCKERSRRWISLQEKLPPQAIEDLLSENSLLSFNQGGNLQIGSDLLVFKNAIRIFERKNPIFYRLVLDKFMSVINWYVHRRA